METVPYPFARWPRLTRRHAVLLGRAARRGLFEELERGRRALAALGRADVEIDGRTPQVLEAGAANAPFAPFVVAIVLASDTGNARAVIDVEAHLAIAAVASALGASPAEAVEPTGPLSDGERGVLAYLAARALTAAGVRGWRVAAVLGTAEAAAEACGPGACIAWVARVGFGSTAGAARLRVSEAALDRLPDERCAAVPESVAGLEVGLTVDAGWARLAAAELGTAVPGDVLVLDAFYGRPGERRPKVRVRIAGARRTVWWCVADEGGLRLDEVQCTGEAIAGKGRPMEPRERTDAILERAGDAPVEVTVELARFTMPLEQLAALQPGEVVLAGRAVGDRVALRVGDRVVGTGELVDVEGEVGVRILSRA